jgi:hypothetical protein
VIIVITTAAPIFKVREPVAIPDRHRDYVSVLRAVADWVLIGCWWLAPTSGFVALPYLEWRAEITARRSEREPGAGCGKRVEKVTLSSAELQQWNEFVRQWKPPRSHTNL